VWSLTAPIFSASSASSAFPTLLLHQIAILPPIIRHPPPAARRPPPAARHHRLDTDDPMGSFTIPFRLLIDNNGKPYKDKAPLVLNGSFAGHLSWDNLQLVWPTPDGYPPYIPWALDAAMDEHLHEEMEFGFTNDDLQMVRFETTDTTTTTPPLPSILAVVVVHPSSHPAIQPSSHLFLSRERRGRDCC
jgi:hypothetical protein